MFGANYFHKIYNKIVKYDLKSKKCVAYEYENPMQYVFGESVIDQMCVDAYSNIYFIVDEVIYKIGKDF